MVKLKSVRVEIRILSYRVDSILFSLREIKFLYKTIPPYKIEFFRMCGTYDLKNQVRLPNHNSRISIENKYLELLLQVYVRVQKEVS